MRTRSTAAMAPTNLELAPRSATIAQYIKDLSVESPSAPQAFQWQAQPQLEVQFNINVEKIADESMKSCSRSRRPPVPTRASISSSI